MRQVLSAIVLCFIFVQSAFAVEPAKHFQVAARALGFVEGLSGTVKVAIVYDPKLPSSIEARDDILEKFGSGMRAGQLLLTAVPIDINNLGAEDAQAIYVTSGLSAYYTTIKKLADTRKIPTIGADLNCVQANLCVVGAEIGSNVQVYVSHAAAVSSGVSFQSSFLMLVKEL